MTTHLKAESAIVIIITVCIFLTFYFALLSFQTIDDTLKKQFVTFATLFLITGGVITACMTIYLGMKKTFIRLKNQIRKNKET